MTIIFSHLKKYRYLKRISRCHKTLGIMANADGCPNLPVQMEAPRLVSIGPDIYQRDQRLAPQAASAWQAMKQSAAGSGIELQVVSAFRSLDYQAGIIRRKLEKGQVIGEILRVSAAPGYSEHHTGRAVDVTTPGAPVLEEDFERTEAFAWLTAHAGKFGFRMTFPRNNPFGVIYEPWHWAWTRPEI